MIEKNKELLSLSKVGINVVNLGSTPKRKVKDSEGFYKILHSLAASSFLKIDSINYIKFYCQDYNNRIISIE